MRLNTDAIDNSAGVNTSDIEVNIKIALTPAVRDGRLSRDARNALLVEMTEDVAALVLRNNYLQTLALSLSARRGLEFLGFQQRLMQTLERRGLLDRAVEFLPDDTEIAERRRRSQPLTRPELAVLLAYAKLSLYDELLESNVPDDPYLGRELDALLSRGDRGAVPGRAGASSPAARDHRDPARQLDHQPRRAVLRGARSRIRPGRRSPRWRLPSRRCATATR